MSLIKNPGGIRNGSTKIPLAVKAALCAMMIVPGGITYWLTCIPETYRIGTFYGGVCIVVFAACGIYHRGKLNEIQRTKPIRGGNRHAPSRCV